MHRSLRFLLTLCTLAFSLAPVGAHGRADSSPVIRTPSFLYGAHLHPDGQHVDKAIEIAAWLKMDMISMNFDWAHAWPDPTTTFHAPEFEHAMDVAHQRGKDVLLAITHSPAWALTPEGPDPSATIDMIRKLVQRFPNLTALELFPGANTSTGWGVTPNPGAYLRLVNLTQEMLQTERSDILLVVAGLTPVGWPRDPDDMDDIIFLEHLYDLGGAELMSVVSVQYPNITGEPMATPFRSENRVLRHYELVRDVMLRRGHQQAEIWITKLAWPSGKIASGDGRYHDLRQQAHWLEEAYSLLRAQLYIGAAFFHQLNPVPNTDTEAIGSSVLVQSDTRLHPVIDVLGGWSSNKGNASQRIWETKALKKIYSPRYQFMSHPE
jgi:hypothetical protein